MIYGEFAVDPEAFSSWIEFKYFVDRFGFQHGALISQFPKSWVRCVIQHFDTLLKDKQISDIEYANITEKLTRIKQDRLIRLGRPWNSGQDWYHNALRENDGSAFYKVVVKSVTNPSDSCKSIDDIDETDFNGLRECKVTRGAQSYIEVSSLLLRVSRTVKIIDPYFDFSVANQNILTPYLSTICQDGYRCNQLQVHLHYQESRIGIDINQFLINAQSYITSVKPADAAVEVFCWSDEGCKIDLHPRYLISELGGIRFDRGFSEPPDRDERNTLMDVVALTEVSRAEIWETYHESSSALKLLGNFRID